jgi:N-acetylglucosamine kinase-like BadF-type ATPase
MPVTYVGIDSGGTRTSVRIIGESEAPLTIQVDGSLSGALEPQHFGPCLNNIFAALAAATDVSSEVYAFVSAAAYSPRTQDALRQALHDAATSALPGRIRAAGIANDGVALLLGHGADGIVIAGTGSSILLRESPTRLRQLGGHEWVACDQGAGFWIGLEAIREVYRDVDEGRSTELVDRFRETYGVVDDTALLVALRGLAVAGPGLKREIARFAAQVCALADAQSVAAQSIVRRQAAELATMLARGVTRAGWSTSGATLVQCGGVFGSDFYRHTFEATVSENLPEPLRYVRWRRVESGVDAALNLAQTLPDEHTTKELLALEEGHAPAVVRF